MRRKIFLRYIQNRIAQKTSRTASAAQHRLERRAQDRQTAPAPRCRTQGRRDEVLDRPAHDVDRDRVRADHEQRERPPLPALPLDERVEAGEHQDDQAAAVERVGRGPDALHDRVDVQPLQAARPASVSATPATTRPFSLSTVERGVFSHRPAHIPSIIVASVGMKLSVDHPPPLKRNGVCAREQVQEPHVERPRQVRVLVEVREEARVEMRPVRRHADLGVVEVRAGQRIQRERAPRTRRGSRRTRRPARAATRTPAGTGTV